MLRSIPVTFSAGVRAMSRNGHPRRRLVLLPAHSPEPQLGAAVVIRRIERVDVRRSDRTAAVQRLQPKRRAARIGGAAAETSRDRKRNRRMHEIMRNELQQIGIARRG